MDRLESEQFMDKYEYNYRKQLPPVRWRDVLVLRDLPVDPQPKDEPAVERFDDER
jgi:hypothetical protein